MPNDHQHHPRSYMKGFLLGACVGAVLALAGASVYSRLFQPGDTSVTGYAKSETTSDHTAGDPSRRPEPPRARSADGGPPLVSSRKAGDAAPVDLPKRERPEPGPADARKDQGEGSIAAEVEALKEKGWEAVPELLAILMGDTSDSAKVIAATGLGAINADMNDPAISETLKTEVIPILEGILAGDADSVLKRQAVVALGQIRDDASVDVLVGVVASRDRHLAELAVRALGEVGTAGAQKALSGYVTMDGNQSVSMMSAFVLWDRGDLVAAYDLLPVLQAAVDDRDVMLTASAIAGINRREKDPSLAQALAEAVPALEEVINDDSRSMWDKVGAARTLGTIGSDEARRVLLDVARDVENPNGHVQRTAIQMLGASGSADVAGVLEDILAYSTEIEHQMHIATALVEVASRHPDSYAVVIAESVAIPLIHSIAISAETTDLQRHAVEALGEIGTPTDITVLRQAGIANRDLATAVEEAISDIEDRAQGIDTGRDSMRWWRPL